MDLLGAICMHAVSQAVKWQSSGSQGPGRNRGSAHPRWHLAESKPSGGRQRRARSCQQGLVFLCFLVVVIVVVFSAFRLTAAAVGWVEPGWVNGRGMGSAGGSAWVCIFRGQACRQGTVRYG